MAPDGRAKRVARRENRMAKKKTSQNPVVGLVQMSCSPDPDKNLKKALSRIGEAARQGATIVCLQELFKSQYFCQSEDTSLFALAEPIPGETTRKLAKAARQHKVVLVSSLFERRTAGLYHNTAVIFDQDGSVVGRYRKMHIPDDPLYYEKFYFTPGDLGFQVHQTSRGACGVLVCWDQWFPEAARLTALQGAQFLFYPTAIGWLPGEAPEMNEAQHSAWETAQRAHAIANGVFVVAVNRVGLEGQLQFWGQSFVADPFGRVLARASSTDEETMLVECDLSLIEQTRQNWPFLRDRRIDAYGGLTQRLIQP